MAKKKKRYTEEFKMEAVRLLVTRGAQSVAEIAKSLGVQPSQLYEWRRRLPMSKSQPRVAEARAKMRNSTGSAKKTPSSERRNRR